MGYRLGANSIVKREVPSIKERVKWPKFMIFGPVPVAQNQAKIVLCAKRALGTDHRLVRCCEAGSMPFVVRSDSENEAELVFLSPDEEPRPQQGDQGASPVLRRSNRKRKSTAAYSETDMSKSSSSKKKKSSPDPGKSMPRIPRTPQTAEQPSTAAQDLASTTPKQKEMDKTPQQSGLEALLVGMEGRLSQKIDATNTKVDKALALAVDTNTALEDLEAKVKAVEGAVDTRIGEAEVRIQTEVKEQVRTLVYDQLRSAGFDPDLTAGDLSTVRSIASTTCLLYTSPSPRDRQKSRMPSSA